MIYLLTIFGTLTILILLAIYGLIDKLFKEVEIIKNKEINVIVELHEKQTNTIGLN